MKLQWHVVKATAAEASLNRPQQQRRTRLMEVGSSSDRSAGRSWLSASSRANAFHMNRITSAAAPACVREEARRRFRRGRWQRQPRQPWVVGLAVCDRSRPGRTHSSAQGWPQPPSEPLSEALSGGH